MNVDLINGLFEAGGALCTWHNAWQLHKDRGEVRGASPVLVTFMSVWGLWNLIYYPSLNQWFSFAAGIALVLGNLAWVAQLAWYRWQDYRYRVFVREHAHEFPFLAAAEHVNCRSTLVDDVPLKQGPNRRRA